MVLGDGRGELTSMAEVVEEARYSTGVGRAGGLPAPSARLVCIDPSVLPEGSGSVIDLYGDNVTIGRAVSNSVTLKAKGVSRRHARLVWDEIEWAIEDLGSTNGVRVNRHKVARQRLEPGDVVQLGRARFEYRPTGGSTDAESAELEEDTESTVVISPGVKLLLEESPSAPPGARIAPKTPHPRTAANVEPAEVQVRRARRVGPESWLWWLAAGVVIILAIGYSLL